VTNVSGRALWGLKHGVPQKLQSKVAQVVLRLLEARSNPYIQQECLSLLAVYGTTNELPGLEKIHSRPAISGKLKNSVKETLNAIRTRSQK
jgi:hypothetical protein